MLSSENRGKKRNLEAVLAAVVLATGTCAVAGCGPHSANVASIADQPEAPQAATPTQSSTTPGMRQAPAEGASQKPANQDPSTKSIKDLQGLRTFGHLACTTNIRPNAAEDVVTLHCQEPLTDYGRVKYVLAGVDAHNVQYNLDSGAANAERGQDFELNTGAYPLNQYSELQVLATASIANPVYPAQNPVYETMQNIALPPLSASGNSGCKPPVLYAKHHTITWGLHGSEESHAKPPVGTVPLPRNSQGSTGLACHDEQSIQLHDESLLQSLAR